MPADIKALAKPLIDELKTRIEAAADDDAKREARADFLDELKDAAPDVYNAIHSTAFNAGRGEGTKKTGKTEEKVKELQAKNAELEEQLEAANANKPDVAAIEAKYQQKIAKAEQVLASEREERTRSERDRAIKDARTEVESALVAAGYRPRAAHLQVIEIAERGLIKLTEDGSVAFMQVGDPETPYPQPRNGAKPYDALVKALRRDADQLDITSNVDRGAGAGAPGGRRPVPGLGDVNGVPALKSGPTLPDVSPDFVQDHLTRHGGGAF